MENTLIGNGIRINGRDYEIVGATGGDIYSEGGPTVFDLFDLTPYTYLQIERSSITGDTITASYEAQGVFKMRTGSISNSTTENVEQGSTLHILPTESFISSAPSNREHYRLTLVETSWSDFEVLNGS